MRFTFDADQREFQTVLREFLAAECTPAQLRALWSHESGRSVERWQRLAELGAVGLTAPEAEGGLGLDLVALVLPLEEAGRAALPEPLGAVAAVAVPLLIDLDLGADWLERVAAGEALVVAGLDGGLVADAHVADLLLLAHGDELHAVDPAGVGLERRASIDPSRRLFRVEWTPARGSRVAGGEAGAAMLAAARDRAALRGGGRAAGVTARLIDMTVAYARDRRQFGRPIGAFQAVKHLLADALVALAFARPVVYRAAASLADGAPERSRDASMAKAAASDAAVATARTALQVHGALGYTWEHDLSIWIKRAHALALAGGDARRHRERVADAVLGACEQFRCAPCGTSAAPRATHDAHVAEPRIAVACGPRHPRPHHMGRTDHCSADPWAPRERRLRPAAP